MKNDKRERILDAAEQLMSQMQNREISVNMIAKEAQIGKGSVYYYFESKEEIIEAVVERCYKRIILEFFSEMQTGSSAIDKIKLLFRSVVKEEFFGKQKNLIGSLHLHEDARLHNKMKIVAVQEFAPVLTALLQEGCSEGSIYTETPKESAEMIVAIITFFLDDSIFPADQESMYRKLKIFANVLDVNLQASPGSFDFLWRREA